MKMPQFSVFNYTIQNTASGEALDIFIDGDIVDAETQGMYKYWLGDDTSVSYKSFRKQVSESEAKTFNIYINSGGGLVTDAMAIHDFLIELQSKGKVVNTIGRGIIASAATYILLAGEKPTMSSNSWMMIHNVSGMTWGNVNEIENYARTMRQFNDSAVKFYQKVSGKTEEELGKMMDQETWMTAEDAKGHGFIKSIAGEAKFKNTIKPEQWQFKNRAVLNSYNSFTHKNEEMDSTKLTDIVTNAFDAVLQKLGFAPKDDASTKNAIAEFGTSVTNAIKEVVPTQETIQNMTNEAVGEALKNIGENEAFKNAVANLNKDAVTEDTVKDLVTEGLKNTATKDDVEKSKKDVLNAIAGNSGDKTDEVEKVINTGKRFKNQAANRFAGTQWSKE